MLVLAWALTAHASVHTWVQQRGWLDAVPGADTITFGEWAAPYVLADQYPGIRFTDGDDTTWFDTQYGGDFLIALGGPSMTLELAAPTTAFAARFPFQVAIELFAANGARVDVINASGSTERTFFGVTSDTPFTRVRLSQGPGNEVVLDQIWWGDLDPTTLPTLSVSGTCPSSLSFAIGRLSPRKRFAVIRSGGTGTYVLPNGACAGTRLDLAAASATTAYLGTASGQGTFNLSNASVAPAACGSTIQVVDLQTCAVSPARRLP